MRRSVEMALAPRSFAARWIEFWWLAALLVAAAAQVNAQPAPPAPPAPPAAPAAPALPAPAAGEPLRQRVDARFEVLPVSDGLLLKPRQGMDGIRALEVRDGQLAIDGREAEIDDLERRIGRQAASPVRALLELDPDELEQIFGLGAVPPPADDTDVDALQDRLESERDRLESEMEARRAEIERQQEEIRARIEREMGRHADDPARTAEEIARDVQRDVQRDIERAKRRRYRADDARVVMGTPVHVAAGESTGNVVSIGGGVTVDGEVDGNAVSVGGSSRITGVVTGDAVSVGGSVRLGPKARVMGNVVSVGGTVEKAPGAEVMGQVTEVSLWQGMAGGWFGNWGDWNDWSQRQPDYFDGALFDFLECIVFVLVLMLLGALVAAIARNPLERTAAVALAQPWKSGVVGILAVILFVPVILIVVVLLAVSVIGIPLLLLVPFALIGCVFASFFGYLGAAQALARWSEGRFGWRLRGPVTSMILGLFLLHGAWLMARLVDVVDSSKDVGGFLRLMLWLFWLLVNLCAAFVGIGAVIIARRSGPAPVQPLAAPPPVLPPSPAPYEPYGRELTATSTPAPESARAEEAEDWDEPFEDFDEPRTATAATVAPESEPVEEPEADEDDEDRERRQA